MIVAALAIPVLFWPGIMGAATAPRWAFLSVAVPLLAFGLGKIRITAGHLCGALFILWSAVTLLWSPVLDGYSDLWKLILLGFVFCLAGQMKDMRPFFVALGIGAAINCAVIVPQAFGWQGLPQNSHPGGLFLNSNWAAEFCAVTLVGLIGYRVWWLVPFPAVAILCTSSRGAVMGIAAAAVAWLWTRSRPLAVLAGALLLAAGALMLANGSHAGSGLQRIMVWRDTLDHLTWHGAGLGSFAMAYPSHGFMFGHAHNDLLQIVSETGIGGVFFAGAVAAAMLGKELTERCVLACFLMEGLAGFPFYLPATAFVAAAVAGRLCADGTDLRQRVSSWRVSLFDGPYRPCRVAAKAFVQGRAHLPASLENREVR